jgi:hypothetical protein
MNQTELIFMHIGLIRYVINDLRGVYSNKESSAFLRPLQLFYKEKSLRGIKFDMCL